MNAPVFSQLVEGLEKARNTFNGAGMPSVAANICDAPLAAADSLLGEGICPACGALPCDQSAEATPVVTAEAVLAMLDALGIEAAERKDAAPPYSIEWSEARAEVELLDHIGGLVNQLSAGSAEQVTT